MSCASSPVPPRNLPPVTHMQEGHFLPGPLTCPKTLPETLAPKALLVAVAPALSACPPELCFIYLFVWEADRLLTAHMGLGCFFLSLHVKEKRRKAGQLGDGSFSPP